MADGTDRTKIAVGDVVRWGEVGTMGLLEKIRVINSGQYVESFSGDLEDVILSVRNLHSTAFIWAKKDPVEKTERVTAKNFLAEMGITTKEKRG